MKTKLIAASVVILLGGGLSLNAQDMTATNANPPSSSPHWWHVTDSPDLYRSYELNLQGFGFGTVDEHTLNHLTGNHVRRDAQIGAGAGLSFFLAKYIGIEGEGYSETTHHSFVNDAGGNLILRLPIGNTGLAPYIFGGGGHQFEPVDCNYADGGGGLEYRFTSWIGLFVDARWVATVRTGNYGMGRIGVDFSF
jgi:hypothetical protein